MATNRKRDRENALAAAEHAYAIKRALELSSSEVERAALARLGPVPQTCQRCRQRPPRTILKG